MCLNFIPSSIHSSIPAQPNLGARVSWIAQPSGFGLDGSTLRLQGPQFALAKLTCAKSGDRPTPAASGSAEYCSLTNFHENGEVLPFRCSPAHREFDPHGACQGDSVVKACNFNRLQSLRWLRVAHDSSRQGIMLNPIH